MTLSLQINANRVYRMAPPVLFGANSVLRRDSRVYDGTPSRDGSGAFSELPGGEHVAIDVPGGDAAYLRDNGWLPLGMVGTTAQRPAANLATAGTDYLQHGMVYIDTTLTKVLIFDKPNLCWRDPLTGQIA